MFRIVVAAALLLGAGAAGAQTPQAPAPRLPIPAVNENAPPATFIEAARQALAAGRTGEAQEAIERAESRTLDRAVKPSLASQPSQQPLVQQLRDARTALAAGDKLRATEILAAALKNPEAQQP